MNPNDTHALILQYSYGETDAKTSEEVEKLMSRDPEYQQYYAQIAEVRQVLGQLHAEPDPTSVAIISEHSHDSHTEAV